MWPICSTLSQHFFALLLMQTKCYYELSITPWKQRSRMFWCFWRILVSISHKCAADNLVHLLLFLFLGWFVVFSFKNIIRPNRESTNWLWSLRIHSIKIYNCLVAQTNQSMNTTHSENIAVRQFIISLSHTKTALIMDPPKHPYHTHYITLAIYFGNFYFQRNWIWRPIGDYICTIP